MALISLLKVSFSISGSSMKGITSLETWMKHNPPTTSKKMPVWVHMLFQTLWHKFRIHQSGLRLRLRNQCDGLQWRPTNSHLSIHVVMILGNNVISFFTINTQIASSNVTSCKPVFPCFHNISGFIDSYPCRYKSKNSVYLAKKCCEECL